MRAIDECKFNWNTEHDRNMLRGNLGIRRKEINAIKIEIGKTEDIKTVLDIGCGVGKLVNELSQLRYKVKGLDKSKSAIRFAKGMYGNKFKVADVEKMSIKDESVDVIVLLNSLQCMEFPLECIEKLKKACKKCLIVIITKNIKNTKWEIIENDLKEKDFETEKDGEFFKAVYHK